MSVICAGPDASLGVAVRLSDYLNCQARALGENGFQALAGGPVGTSLLSGLVTIFIAFIGYRLILGHTPDVRDGIGWAVRLGIVLALVTSWPAFQTLVYRVVVDGPVELASVLLPASGLPSESLDTRVQQAYDTIRLGAMGLHAAPADPSTQVGVAQSGQATTQQVQFQSPLPNTASMLVISTSGFAGALKIAIGFLLAVAPLAIMSLLFDATLGLFNGWLRALAGMALAVLGVTIVTAIDLMMVESELAHLQAFRLQATSDVVDVQALTTIVVLFLMVTLIVSFAAIRMGSAIKLPLRRAAELTGSAGAWGSNTLHSYAGVPSARQADTRSAGTASQSRVATVAEALARTVQREQANTEPAMSPAAPSRYLKVSEAAARADRSRATTHSGGLGRRGLGKRSRSAARRDRMT